MERVSLEGKKFNRLTVLKFMGVNSNRQSRWLTLCDCGNEKIALGTSIQSGHTKSCGCLLREGARIRMAARGTHRLTASRTYSSWMSMKQRCENPRGSGYKVYGAAGVTVCDRWKSFELFLEDMGERPPGTTLDRWPDRKGNYEPGNCRWGTPREQSINRNCTLFYEHNGERLCLQDWARRSQVSAPTLKERLEKGWSFEDALSIPPRSGNVRSARNAVPIL